MHKKVLTTAAVAALVVAPVAAFASSGSSHSGQDASHATVTGRDIVDGSLSTRDVRDGTLKVADLSKGAQQQLTALPTITRVSTSGLASNNTDTSFKFSTACPAGTTVISGGAFALSPGSQLTGSFPGSTSDPQANAWTGTVSQPASTQVGLAVTVFAMCQVSS
jgi:hypothetical protein